VGLVVALGLVVGGLSAAPAAAYLTPNICSQHSIGDSPNAGLVDVRTFVLRYDCANHFLSLEALTAAPIPYASSQVLLVAQLDTDGDPTDGCQGADYRVFLRDEETAFLDAVSRTPTCDQSTWTNDYNVLAGGHAFASDFDMSWPLSEVGNAATVRVWGGLEVANLMTGANTTDRFPDTGSTFASCYLTPARASIAGYWLAAANGDVSGFGDVGTCRGATDGPVARPIVGVASTPDHRGLWSVATDGGIFTSGDARFFGSTGAIRLNQPIVGMAPTPSGNGYWLVASDGGIFSYGDARFFGSTGAIRLNQPIVGMASTPSGHGYWLVAADGGIFSFGDARFFGSTGAIRLSRPIVGMTSTPSGNGYWLVASDGGIFSFGDAHFLGSTGALHVTAPIVGMRATASGRGYRLVANDGSVFDFGDAAFAGSLSGTALPPGGIVGIAS
jgi:hypothetical protein